MKHNIQRRDDILFNVFISPVNINNKKSFEEKGKR